jgi:hypothetical protein
MLAEGGTKGKVKGNVERRANKEAPNNRMYSM